MGGTVFVSSHLLGEVEHLADEVVVINQGSLVARGAMSELEHAETLVRTPAPERLALVLEAAGGAVRRKDSALFVRGLSMTEIGDEAYGAGVAVHELSAQTGSLEDLFMGWTGDDGRRVPEPKPREVVGV